MYQVIESQKEMIKDEIVNKGPPKLRIFFGKPQQKSQLPMKAFKTYDKDGNFCRLAFESDGIFIYYKEKDYETNKPTNERIFYNEILSVKSFPTKNFSKFYNNLIMKTKFGYKVFYFIPVEYETIIRKVIHGL